MSKKLLALLLVFTMVFTFVLVGCNDEVDDTNSSDNNVVNDDPNDDTKDDSDKYGGTVRRAIWSSPPGVLHPALYESQYDSYIISLVYDSMVGVNPKLEFEPAMAEKWDISDDSKSVTFYLRDGLKWHDGKPVTTDDIEFSYKFIAHKDYTGPHYSTINAIKGIEEYHAGNTDQIEGIEIINEKTIKITTEEVYAPFFNDIASTVIIPKHIWNDIPVGEASEATEILRNPIGSGPFKMEEFVADQYVKLVAYDDYWDGRPYLDSFIIQVANEETSQAQMINGEIEFMDISSMDNDTLGFLEDGGAIVQQFSSDGYQYLGLNNRLDLFKDKKVRQAFAYAIDRQSMVDNLMDGNGTVCNVPLAPGHWAFPDNVNEYKHNTEKAIDLLKEAGWEYKDGKMYRDGNPVKITLKYPSGNKVRESSAPLIQQNLKDIGIEAELMLMDFGTLLQQVVTDQDFEMFLMAWSLTPDPDGIGIWHSDYTDSGEYNFAGFVNDENDQLLEEGVKYLDIEKRKSIYQDWGKVMNEEMPIVYLYSMNIGRAMSPKLKGTQIYTFSDYYKVNKWYLEE